MNDHSNSLLAAAELLNQAGHLDLADLDETKLVRILAIMDCKIAEIEARLAEQRIGDILAVTQSQSPDSADQARPTPSD